MQIYAVDASSFITGAARRRRRSKSRKTKFPSKERTTERSENTITVIDIKMTQIFLSAHVSFDRSSFDAHFSCDLFVDRCISYDFFSSSFVSLITTTTTTTASLCSRAKVSHWERDKSSSSDLQTSIIKKLPLGVRQMFFTSFSLTWSMITIMQFDKGSAPQGSVI